MCEPATLSAIGAYVSANAGYIAAGTAIASTAVSAYGQYDTARQAHNSARNSADLANAEQAAQQEQINKKATDELVARSRQATLELGALNTIFAETGVTGVSHDRLSGQVEGDAITDATTIERNRQAAASQGSVSRVAYAARAQSQANSVTRPSLIGTGLQIAAAGTDAYVRSRPARSGP